MIQKKEPLLPQTLFLFILHFIKPHALKIMCLFCISSFWAFDLSFRPYMMKVILDKVAQHDPSQGNIATILLIPATLYLLSLLTLNIVFRFYDALRSYLLPQVQAEITSRMMAYVECHSHEFFQKNFSGSIVSQIREMADGVKEIIKISINKFFSHTLALSIAVITITTVHPVLALILLTWTICFLLVTVKLSKDAHLKSKESSRVKSVTMGHMVDSITNIMSVRLFARNEDELSRLDKQLNRQVAAGQKQEWSMLRVRAFQGMSVFVMIALLLNFLIYARQQNLVSIGDFALILSISISISEAIWNISDEFVNFSEFVGRCNQSLGLITQPHTVQDSPLAKLLVVTKGIITFQDVCFTYPSSKPLFRNINITLHSRQRVGLIGCSGGGKSTFVNLITRIFDIQSGSILIDGQNIKDVEQKSLRKNISFIPQDTMLFHRTLMENIAYGSDHATMRDVTSAAQKAHADQFIKDSEKGYDTIVGERGIKLSGGQRQRIAIARAFLKNAPILILDEATSALDSETENYIQESLNILMSNKTVIVIAHRLSTLISMDRILVFDKGNIVQDGIHQDLIQQTSKPYAKLWNAQVGGFIQESGIAAASKVNVTHLTQCKVS